MQVFAHRGFSALYPENSQTAIRASLDTQCSGIEIDIFQVEDEFFVVHDPWLSRLFGINKKVDLSSAQELYNLRCPDGLPIPTLSWLIETLAQTDKTLNIELKSVADIEHFVAQLTRLTSAFSMDESQLLISSFTHPYLAQIQTLKPDWKIGLLLAHHPLSVESYFSQLRLHSLHLCIDALSPELVAEAKTFGVAVLVYTVDQQIDIEYLFHSQVDGIFANHPKQAHKIIKKLI